MNSLTNWGFFKQDQVEILWVHICKEDLAGIATSMNNWWERRNPEYKFSHKFKIKRLLLSPFIK